MTIKIEKGVEMPRATGGSKYPWREMGVGDSFFVSSDQISAEGFRGLAHNAAKRLGFKVATRTVEGGYRVWRIE